jgi:hypothetical protein
MDIDEQLEAEARLKTQRLQELIKGIVDDAVVDAIRAATRDYPFVSGLHAELMPMIVNDHRFSDAVKQAILYRMRNLTTNSTYW